MAVAGEGLKALKSLKEGVAGDAFSCACNDKYGLSESPEMNEAF